MNNNERWMEQGSCTQTDPDIWFTNNIQYPSILKRVCNGCPVIENCLKYSLEWNVRGFWAGTSEIARDRLRKRLGIRPKPLSLEQFLPVSAPQQG